MILDGGELLAGDFPVRSREFSLQNLDDFVLVGEVDIVRESHQEDRGNCGYARD